MKFDRRPAIAQRLKQGPGKSELKAELLRMLKQVRPDRSVYKRPDGSSDYLNLVFHALTLRQTLPNLSTVRFACRLVRQNKEMYYCDRLLHSIANEEELEPKLKQIANWIACSRVTRKRCMVESTVYKKSLQQFLSGIRSPQRAPLVDFSDPSEGSLAAKTNGKRVFVPYRVDISDDNEHGQLINESVLYYLAFHEAQHWGIFGARSTFEFDFETDEGRRLLREIRPSRAKLQKYQESQQRRSIYEQLLYEEGVSLDSHTPQLTHIEVVALSSKSPRLFHWFYNCFEDVRIHRQAVETGMGELQAITNRLHFKFQTHPAFLSPFEKFSSHVVALVHGQDSSHTPLPKVFGPTLAQLSAWMRECHSTSSIELSPERSATFAFRAVELVFREHGENAASQQELEDAVEKLTPSPEKFAEVMLRWALNMETNKKRRVGGGNHLPPRNEKRVEGNKFDEFSIISEQVEAEAVTVMELVFNPTRKPHPIHSLAGYRGLRLGSFGGITNAADMVAIDHVGDEIAMEIVPELVASIRSTGEFSGKYYWNRFSSAPTTTVSVLTDLSVSMEQYRRDLPVVPMQMAIAAARQINEEATQLGLRVENWGILDGGRQPVHMYKINANQINRVHAIGIGGARLGAGIRFLSRRYKPQSGKHIIICLTDGAGLYLNEGNDDLFRKLRKNNCAMCQLRSPGKKGCSVEKSDRVGTGKFAHIFRKADYQYADIGHAIDSAPPNTMVMYVEFTKEPFDEILNRFLYGKWISCSGNLDLSMR